MSLINAIATAATKALMAKLPAAAATKFNLDEDEFKEFLQEFLGQECKAGKGGAKGASTAPKGTNGKGRISGYILFSNANRQAVKDADPDIKFTEVGKELGKMWGELSDAEKAKWNVKAQKQNEANGLPTPTPGAGKAKAPAKGKAPAAAKGKAAAAKGKAAAAKGKAAAAKTADAAPVMKIARDKDAKAWVVQGTEFVVQSPKNKVVVGKLKAGKVVALTAADVKKCQANGWEVKAAEKAAPAKGKAGVKAKAKAPEPDEDDDEDDDDDAGSDAGDDEDDDEDAGSDAGDDDEDDEDDE